MKEKIYTIPINEAYDTDCNCPICHLEEKLEDDAIEYALGAAMMEPDYRTVSNEKGYCNHHFEKMFCRPNKLSLALVLETHLDEIQKKLDSFDKEISALESEKKGLFKKSNVFETAQSISSCIDNIEKSCVICDKINSTVNRYCDVLLYMWANDEDFRKKFDASKGVCLKHEKILLDLIPKALNDKQARKFISLLRRKQKDSLSHQRELLHKFVLKFDYRYKDMELGEARTAPSDTIEKISGYIKKDN